MRTTADDELEAIRRRRLAELQARQRAAANPQESMMAEAQARAEAEEAEARKDAILRQILTPDARERLGRLRIARPEESRGLESQLISLAQSGRLAAKIDDVQLKQILARMSQSQRDISIRRK